MAEEKSVGTLVAGQMVNVQFIYSVGKPAMATTAGGSKSPE